MRAKVLLLVVALASMALALIFLVPRGGPSGGAEPRNGTAEANTVSSSESKVQSLKSKVQGAGLQRKRSEAGRTPGENQDESANQRSTAAAEASAATSAASPEPKALASGSASGRSTAQKETQDLDDAHQLAVETRVQELLDLGMEDDPKSLETILSELSNPDADIRKAAVEATVQFGSQDAIPALENAVFWAENADQRKEIADAIEFLKLPKLTEAAALLPATQKKAVK